MDFYSLYYDSNLGKFSLSEDSTNELVFTPSNKIGWTKGINPPIRCGIFDILICSNIYPMAPKKEYIFVDIKVNGVLLLPIKKSLRCSGSYWHIGLNELSFVQYGPGNNYGKSPHTIFNNNPLNWNDVLLQICIICNDYKNWVFNEMTDLIRMVKQHELTHYWHISNLISIVRMYDEIVPECIPVYRSYLDQNCIVVFNELIDFIYNKLPKINSKELTSKNVLNAGDLIWKYIKDYYCCL